MRGAARLKRGLMNSTSSQIKDALRQQLLSDGLLGMRFVPIPADALASLVSSRSAHPVTSTSGRAASGDEQERLRVLDDTQVKGCTKCGLSGTRTQTVFGQGNPSARLVFVGEAPGYEEDKQGLAFVGRAGQLLTKMIQAMGLSRDDVFICNVLKCRPPGNRDPSADEILACSSYLKEQLRIIRPEVLVALGAPAAKTLLNTAQSIGKLRGRFHDYEIGSPLEPDSAIPLMPTYHPAYLLRSPGEKKKTWEDLQKVMGKLGLSPPGN